jgi:DtxR family Mn-dependent transcriptional regulator
MGNPVRDPHGDPIPTEDLTMPSDDTRPLASLRTGEAGAIKRVNGADPAFLRHLQGLGLVPGAQVCVRGYSEFDGNLTLEVNGHTAFVVGPAITNQIFV